MNKVILTGRLAGDPETRTTQSGVSVCTFRLAVQRRFANAQGVREADFLTIVCWRQLADLCAKYLAKGHRAAVEGSIQTRTYDGQDGQRRYVTEILADSVEFLQGKEVAAGGSTQAGAAAQGQTGPEGNGGFVEVDDNDELPF